MPTESAQIQTAIYRLLGAQAELVKARKILESLGREDLAEPVALRCHQVLDEISALADARDERVRVERDEAAMARAQRMAQRMGW